MTIDLRALADTVNDEQEFLAFLAALATDWHEEKDIEALKPSSPYGAGALGWENGTVGAVLEAAASWGEASIAGLPLYEKPANPWRRVAQILLAGKFYE
ncbi:hypothetical protein [Pelomonas sp. KK5]|uniref:DUF7660 family protein n=1 Tax=Pelomonas sp. KK5 TaxID=1855730 RepID=UPI00097C2792|nr:hypothetical protein [Pelomonas sp. KK5]